ncbi:hypothetical protein [Geomonas propionica]|uniref:Uncharacterized protein n=1 Tax=Geomonas propionica TaxID=2798582 RepID=A0ABS0YQI4_9BACT|nr:hypothetical protein [Geomonas propionica]MBJ6800153.1 hypothetical protein [Geomonas propionica]
MNHDRLIRSIINKYSAQPEVQSDIRKVLKYASSQTRMFLQPIIDNEPTKQKTSAVFATEDFEASEAFTEAIREDAVTLIKAITAQVVLGAETFAPVKAALDQKYEDRADVRNYLCNAGRVILEEIESLPQQDLLKLRQGAA